MTTNLEEIYGRYRKADFTDRLNIYLQFPDLGIDFLEIEQKGRRPTFFRKHRITIKGSQSNKWMDQSEIFHLVVTHTLLGGRGYPNYLIWFSKHVRAF